MITAHLVCAATLILVSTEASPTAIPKSKSFIELLDELRSFEANRKTVIKKAVEEAANNKCNATDKFLEVIGEADEILVNIQNYYEAGKVMLDFNQEKSNIRQADLVAKTELVQDQFYLRDQMIRLFAILKTVETHTNDLSAKQLIPLRPVITAIKQTVEVLTPIAKQYKSAMNALKKTAMQ